MIYINAQGEYPRHIGDIQLVSKGWSEGDGLPAGWVYVTEAIRPAAEKNKIVYEGFPVEVDGVMTQNWVVRDMTAEETERRDAPANAKAKLIALGLTEVEVEALARGLIR